MIGIEPNPTIVGSHFVANKGSAGVLAAANLVARTVQFMTPPGIATLAKPWKMRVVTICGDEREVIITFVSTYGLQRQSSECNGGTNEAPNQTFLPK